MDAQSRKCLEESSYRTLQMMTKSLKLPCNFKKVYLIQLICARKSGLEEEVNKIIQAARNERNYNKKSKKFLNKIKSNDSSPDKKTCFSPPINVTPKHTTRFRAEDSPEYDHSLLKYKTRKSLIDKFNEEKSPSTHRLLRSSITKTLNPYCNSPGEKFPKGSKIKISEYIPKLNLMARCVLQHTSTSASIVRNDNVDSRAREITSDQTAVKRERSVSGIYPIMPRSPIVIKKKDVCVRKKDGTISKMNAFIQKRPMNQGIRSDIIQDILKDLNKDKYTVKSSAQDPNISKDSAFSDANSSIEESAAELRNVSEENSLHYHNRATERMEIKNVEENNNQLPKITSVFRKFNLCNVTKTSEHIGSEKKIPLDPVQVLQSSSNIIKLECLYNFNSSFSSSLQSVATTSNTKSTNSIMTVVTSKVQSSQTVMSHAATPNDLADLQNSRIEKEDTLYELLQCDEPLLLQDIPEAFDFVTLDDNENPNVNNSFSNDEMFDDAMEIISSDEEHANDIHRQTNTEWNITFTLGELVAHPMWFSRVIEYNSAIYILSVKFEDPDCFMATLSCASADYCKKTGSITIYNKISGEPFTWEGEIKSVPPELPYQNTINCLKLKLSQLDLLPNSANLKLVNRELLVNSLNTVFVGQTALNEIHIILFVKLLN